MRLINRYPSPLIGLMLGALPFVIVLIVYVMASDARLAANPADKLLPSFSSFGDAIQQYAFRLDARRGIYILWTDTAASLQRLVIGLVISTGLGVVIGLSIGLLPLVRAGLAPFVGVFCVIPPLAVLPILFIVFGLGELSKVVLIVVGITPFLIRDLAFQADQLPREQIIKAQTLGATTWQIAIRVALPQLLPRLVTAIRLSLGPAWLFLIAAEAIAAEDGLGYRIFLVRRFLSMDVILPYVAWITFLAFATDFILARIARSAFTWTESEGRL